MESVLIALILYSLKFVFTICTLSRAFLYLNVDFYWSFNHFFVMFLGAFAILRKATISFVMSVCLSVCCLSVCSSVHPSLRMKQLDSHWKDFHAIWYLNIFRKTVEKIQASLKSDKNNRYFTWRRLYIYDSISLNSSWNEKCFRLNCRESQTHVLCSIKFSENRVV